MNIFHIYITISFTRPDEEIIRDFRTEYDFASLAN